MAFVAVRCVVNFALNGEWSLGSMLVAETWPARLRGRVIGINRGTWCFGAALAGAIATYIIADFGWRVAFAVPAVVSLIAVYVRAKCPESPYWVRMQDRKQRIADAQRRGLPLSAEDQEWVAKAKRSRCGSCSCRICGATPAVATFIACCSTTIYGTVGGWMPLYLSQERHWSTAELWQVLHLVGPGRLPRAACVGLDFRPVRPQAGVLCDAGGRRGVHHAVGVRHDRHRTVDLRPAVEHRLPGLLGTEHDPDGGGLSDADPRGGEWLCLVGRLGVRLRAVAIPGGGAAAAHRFVRRGVPADPGGDGVHGAGRVVVHAGPCRQGSGQIAT